MQDPQLMGWFSVFGLKLSSWGDSQFLCWNSAFGVNLSFRVETQFWGWNSVFGLRLSFWIETQFLDWNSVFGLKLSFWDDSQLLGWFSAFGLFLSFWTVCQLFGSNQVHFYEKISELLTWTDGKKREETGSLNAGRRSSFFVVTLGFFCHCCWHVDQFSPNSFVFPWAAYSAISKGFVCGKGHQNDHLSCHAPEKAPAF